MNRIFFCFLVVICLFSCQEQASLTIDKDKLVDVIADAHIAEAAMQNLHNEQKDSMSLIYYGQVFQIHGISQIIFEENMSILREHPKLAEEVYELVLEKLNKMEINKDKESPIE